MFLREELCVIPWNLPALEGKASSATVESKALPQNIQAQSDK
jgi:hypothetical protein